MTIEHYNAGIPCPVGWTQGFLADFIEESSDRNRARLDLPVYSVTNARGFVPQVEQFARSIHSKDTVNYKVFRKGYFGFNPSRINVGSIALNDVVGAGLLSPMYVVFVTKEILHSSYLKHYTDTYDFRRNVLNGTAGSVRESLNFSAFQAFAFQFPTSKSEQVRIAEILSTVDQAIEQTEALIAKQLRIKTGLMQDLLTRGNDEHGNLRSKQTHEFKDSPLGRIPVEWTVATLGNVIGPIISGWSPTCDSVPAAAGEWGVLKTTAVIWAGYDQNETKRLPAGLRGIESIAVQPDDILITRKGPIDRVGVVVHVHETRPRLMIPDTIFRTRVVAGSDVLPAFLPYALGSAVVQSDWFKKKIGLADAQVNLNHSILRSTLLPKPSLKEQRQIVDAAATMTDQLIADLRILEKLRSLKRGLMQDLLTGERRVTALLAKPEVTTA